MFCQSPRRCARVRDCCLGMDQTTRGENTLVKRINAGPAWTSHSLGNTYMALNVSLHLENPSDAAPCGDPERLSLAGPNAST